MVIEEDVCKVCVDKSNVGEKTDSCRLVVLEGNSQASEVERAEDTCPAQVEVLLCIIPEDCGQLLTHEGVAAEVDVQYKHSDG